MTKAVLVTGGASAGGLAIARRFASAGYAAAVTARRRSDAEQAARTLERECGVPARGFVLELSDKGAAAAVFRELDAEGWFVQALVLNAANLGFGTDPARGLPVFETTADEFSDVVEANLTGNFLVAQQAALRMRQQGGGSMVFIGSNTAYRAIPNRCAYSASKGGLNALSKALAVDLGPYGIRSNVVLPGTIKTQRWVDMGSRQIVNGELTPLGDISDFEDIAEAAWYFGSDASKNVTGTELMVDGGMSAQLYPQILNAYRSGRSMEMTV